MFTVTQVFLVFLTWAAIVFTIGYITKMVIELPEDTLLLRGREL